MKNSLSIKGKSQLKKKRKYKLNRIIKLMKETLSTKQFGILKRESSHNRAKGIQEMPSPNQDQDRFKNKSRQSHSQLLFSIEVLH